MTRQKGRRSGAKWFFISFLLGCGVGVVLGITELLPRPAISGNIAQQGGSDIGFVLAFGIMFGVVGWLLSKFVRRE
jgi:biotin transporter BioY